MTGSECLHLEPCYPCGYIDGNAASCCDRCRVYSSAVSMVSSQYVPSRQSNAPRMLAGSGHHPIYSPNRGPRNKAPGCALDGNDGQSIGSRVLFHISHALRTSSGHISSPILSPGNEAFSSDPCLWGPHLPAISLLLKHTRYRPAPRP